MSEPTVAQRGPFVQEVIAGKFAWCACGNSKNQPYCDGSHKGTGFTPIIVSIPENKTVAWCGCKHSHNKPYCDGSHKSI